MSDDDRRVTLVDVPLGDGSHVGQLRGLLDRAGIEVDLQTWLGGTQRPGSEVMVSVIVREADLARAQRAARSLLSLDGDPTDPAEYWDLATAGNADDAELLAAALADVGIGSMVTSLGDSGVHSIGVRRDDLADAVRLVRRLAGRAPTLALDAELEGLKLTRTRLPDAASRKQRRRIRRW